MPLPLPPRLSYLRLRKGAKDKKEGLESKGAVAVYRCRFSLPLSTRCRCIDLLKNRRMEEWSRCRPDVCLAVAIYLAVKDSLPLPSR